MSAQIVSGLTCTSVISAPYSAIASVTAFAIAAAGGIVPRHCDVLDRDIQLFRAHLCQRRLVALPLRRDGNRHGDSSTLLERDHRAFVRTESGAFRVGRDTDADQPPLRARSFLRSSPLVVPRLLEGTVEQRRKIAFILHDRLTIPIDEAAPVLFGAMPAAGK